MSPAGHVRINLGCARVEMACLGVREVPVHLQAEYAVYPAFSIRCSFVNVQETPQRILDVLYRCRSSQVARKREPSS